ncbi:MAG TPA: hypothetical protein VGL77_18675 [Armatimonadota bacterium]|jgi:photosystem II stability/assembly factor-like uncharacterized protein
MWLPRLFFACSFLALCTLSACANPPVRWEARGPGGGGAMYAPTINPFNPDELYVACDMTPQFHSVDGGKTWMTEDFRQLQSGHECAVRFTQDPLVRWALDYSSPGGSDAVRPVKSVDGGKSWQLLPESAWPRERKAEILYADPQHPERVVVSAESSQLWTTLDGGKTFAQKAATYSSNGMHLAGCFFDGDTIYVGTNAGFYRSANGGATFTQRDISGMPPGEYPVSFAGAKRNGTLRFYCVTTKRIWANITGSEHAAYQGVYVLDAVQQGWVRKTTGIAPNVHPWFVKTAVNDPTTAYLAGGSTDGAPTIYKTTDGGETWSNVLLTTGNRNITTGWAGDRGDFRWSFPEYVLGFDVCPSDANRAIFTDLGCVHLTTDGGQSWREVYTTLAAPRAPGDAIPPGAPYASNGMEMTSSWRVHWFSAQQLFACATDIKGFRSVDGGKTWAFNYTGHNLNTMYDLVTHPTMQVSLAATSSVHDLYMSTYLQDVGIDHGRGMVLYTTDTGATWKPMKDFGKPVIALALDPSNANRLYAAVVHSVEGGIYVTNELSRGPNAVWTKLPNPPRTEGHPYNIRVLHDGTLVCTFSGRRVGNAFTPSAGVFMSSDGGQSWQDRGDPCMRYWTKDLVIDPHDATQNTWYACVYFAWGAAARGGKSGLYRTRDRGQTWIVLADASLSPTGVLNVDSCTVNPRNANELYFTTEYDGLWYTANLSAPRPTFTQVASYRFKHPERVFFNPYQPNEVWVTSFGNGISVGQEGK